MMSDDRADDRVVRIPENSPRFREWERKQEQKRRRRRAGCLWCLLIIMAVTIFSLMLMF